MKILLQQNFSRQFFVSDKFSLADVIGKKLFIYGGGDGKVLSDLYYFDIDLLTWSRMNGTSPGRCAHSSTAIDGKLYIFGGGNGTKCFKDMYIFDAGMSFFFSG